MAIQGHLRFVLALEAVLGWMGMGCQDHILTAETDGSILAQLFSQNPYHQQQLSMHTKSLLILSIIS
jgi:hypothetical protein